MTSARNTATQIQLGGSDTPRLVDGRPRVRSRWVVRPSRYACTSTDTGWSQSCTTWLPGFVSACRAGCVACARQGSPLTSPSNGDLEALGRFEDKIANLLAAAFHELPPRPKISASYVLATSRYGEDAPCRAERYGHVSSSGGDDLARTRGRHHPRSRRDPPSLPGKLHRRTLLRGKRLTTFCFGRRAGFGY